jgi:hypothetical protein
MQPKANNGANGIFRLQTTKKAFSAQNYTFGYEKGCPEMGGETG